MKVCRVRLAEFEGLILDKDRKEIATTVFNECDSKRVTLYRFGRLLKHIEVGRDFSSILSVGKEIGVPQTGDFSVFTGRFEPHENSDIYNCIVVGFGHGKEFVFYGIDQRCEEEVFRLYKAIRDASMVGPREEVSA